MRFQRWKYGVLGLTAAAIFIFLFVQSRRIDEQDHSRYRGDLSQLEGLHATLNEDVLQVRLGLLTYFDPLNNTLDAMDKVRNNLGQIPGFVSEQEKLDINADLATYDKLIAQKRDLIESFKTQNAVLVNSLSYFTVLVSDLTKETAKSGDVSIQNALNGLLQNVLLYNVTVDPNLVPVIQGQIAFLKDNADKFAAAFPESDVNAHSLIVHANIILERKPITNTLIDQMFNLPIQDQITALSTAYETLYETTRQSVSLYQTALYIFSLMVIAFIAFTIISRLRKSADVIRSAQAELQTTYGNLEKRTEELELVNKDLQVATREAREASRMKDEFLAVMSHELRTPLNAMIGFQGILLMTSQLDDKAQHMVQRAQANARRLLTLINDILDVSRIESGRMQFVESDVSIAGLVDRLQSQMGVLADEKNLTFDVHIDPTLPQTLWIDEDAITKIVTNLLGNAFKFTDKGGVTLDILQRLPNVVISVRDTGMGIPTHMHHAIFERFRQVDGSSKRSHGGSGLGLAIVQKLCLALNGTISVQSVVGEGSTFTVILPLESAAEKVAV